MIREDTGISSNRANKAIKALRENGTINRIEDVEVDGEMLKGAYQFVPKEESPDV